MTQAQIKKVSKAAVKTVAKKAAVTKAATKPAVKRTVRKATNQVNYVLNTIARPSQGLLLAGYTAAWLELTGMLKGASIPRATVVKIAGETALNYHKRAGNFEMTETGVKITAQGFAFFEARGDKAPEYRKAYTAILTKGTLDESVGVKTAIAVVKL